MPLLPTSLRNKLSTLVMCVGLCAPQVYAHSRSTGAIHFLKRCEIVEGVKSHFFGEHLSAQEKQWLMTEVGEYVIGLQRSYEKVVQ